MQRQLLFHAGLSILLGALTASHALAEDNAKLDGTWVVQSAREQGKNSTRPVGDKLIIEADELSIERKNGKNNPPPLTIKTDPSQTPPHVDLTLVDGEQTNLLQGVFLIAEDTLQLCLARPGSPRPKTVVSEEGEAQISLVLKRETAEEKQPDEKPADGKNDTPSDSDSDDAKKD